MQKRYLYVSPIISGDCMSTEEFIKELREKHSKDMEEIEKLLEILKDIQLEESKIYDFYVTSNL
jgi:hypothetical protein